MQRTGESGHETLSDYVEISVEEMLALRACGVECFRNRPSTEDWSGDQIIRVSDWWYKYYIPAKGEDSEYPTTALCSSTSVRKGLMSKPPYANDVVEVSREEASALAACGVEVYWDSGTPWIELEDVLELSVWSIEDDSTDCPNGFWFILKEGDECI